MQEPLQTRLLDRLWELQLQYGCIRDEDIGKLAADLQLSAIEVEGVVSFYHFFHRKPTGRYTIYLNNSIVAEHKGYQRIREAFERETGAVMGSVDRTGTFGLFSTPCIGLSDHEPSGLINFHPFTHLNAIRVKDIVTALKNGADPATLCDEPDDQVRYLPPDDKSVFFRPFTPGTALAKAKALGPEGVLDELRTAELSGRGGAYYPTWKKWEASRQQPARPKYVVCNADEGEPGTFKDRVLLHSQAGSLLEGMLLCAYTIGAEHLIIYLRGEYRWLLPRLEAAVEQYRQAGLLGTDCGGIPGFNAELRIQVGAGSYVCGEETALLESLEGKRGEPRTKWYYPVERGYLQQPTVINNVETFAAAARILELGSAAYTSLGIPGSPGTKLISVSGDCRLPGIYEIEWGMTVAELLELCEAEDPHYIQISGPSGECISIKEKYRRISMLDLLARTDIRCGGSVMIFSRQRDLVQVLLNYTDFFQSESCGICTPCRAGNFIIRRKLERLQHGLANESDLQDLRNWGSILKNTSRCGLGKTATNSLIYAMDKFHGDFAARLDKDYNGLNLKFDLEAATRDYEQYKT
ncbi:MAG TPA: NAD(P)H-dependent oxidoreductase subunit E [Lacibacter sp.]|mgnify:FL=1|nr:NAD(P)H-dependent oxidoreductase subunit E [Lacibacter sp.]HMO89935.1 NAD(P)H-dependent oxidoreductase subunit E [Lacibacter sp.]